MHQHAASVTCWITMTRSSSMPNHNGNLTSRSLKLCVFVRSPETRQNFFPIGLMQWNVVEHGTYIILF